MAQFFTYLLIGKTQKDEDLWTNFKKKCIDEKINYRDALLKAIKLWLSK